MKIAFGHQRLSLQLKLLKKILKIKFNSFLIFKDLYIDRILFTRFITINHVF